MSHRLQVLVPEEMESKIRKAANRLRISKGEWVRRALEQAIEEEQPTTNPLKKLAALSAPTADIDQMLKEIEKGRGL